MQLSVVYENHCQNAVKSALLKTGVFSVFKLNYLSLIQVSDWRMLIELKIA